MQNRDVDESFLIKDNRLPFPDNTFDMAWSDFVQEHIECPDVYLHEIHRVLKPGASYFFRTPNKYHYVSLIARLTPQWFHEMVANKTRGIAPDANELYRTYYRLNSVNAIKRYAKSSGFAIAELRLIEADPSYLMFHTIPFLLGVFYERVVNSSHRLSRIRANILGRFEK